MPPRLGAVLAELGVGASPGEFAALESLLGGSWSGLSDVRGDAAASVDAADLTSGEVTEWLSGLPVGPGVELHVAWVADRIGAQMSLETFAANIGDLWFPAMDDVVCVLHSGGNRMVLVLDHEELITFSSVNLPTPRAGGAQGDPTGRSAHVLRLSSVELAPQSERRTC
jgi:hypothetical protein